MQRPLCLVWYCEHCHKNDGAKKQSEAYNKNPQIK